MSTHWPLQLVFPLSHDVVHFPAAHTWSPAHALPQAPQWLGLALTSTHCCPHSTKPGSHEKPHAPPEQVAEPRAGTLHVVPHSPQLLGSPLVSVQTPEQLSNPVLHSNPQVPPLQVARAFSGCGHASSQPPQ